MCREGWKTLTAGPATGLFRTGVPERFGFAVERGARLGVGRQLAIRDDGDRGDEHSKVVMFHDAPRDEPSKVRARKESRNPALHHDEYARMQCLTVLQTVLEFGLAAKRLHDTLGEALTHKGQKLRVIIEPHGHGPLKGQDPLAPWYGGQAMVDE